MGLFRKVKIGIIAKFHRTDLVICSHSIGKKTPSYSRINMVIMAILGLLKKSGYTAILFPWILNGRQLSQFNICYACLKGYCTIPSLFPEIFESTLQILCIGTDRQSDQGLRCLPFHQHLFDALMQYFIKLFYF